MPERQTVNYSEYSEFLFCLSKHFID
ncbi:hypothetical protein BGLA2_220040 [Burkholderia gladioli]|nr:hypothetical protein BGLA2_220040 [Burkholderia gladioli]